MHYVASRSVVAFFEKLTHFRWYSGDAMIVVWSVNISVRCSCIASDMMAEAQTQQRGDSVTLYTLTDPLVMLRWQGRLSSSGGAVLHTHNFLSGKDNARWQVQPDLAATSPRSPAATPAEIRTESLTLCCHKEKIPGLHTTEVHHITVKEEQLWDTIHEHIM